MKTPKTDHDFMEAALKEAARGARQGEVPVGAVAVIDDSIVARAHNQREKRHDPLGHAEIYLLQKLSRQLKRWRLDDITVYVTLEPCLMCHGALAQARIGRLVYAATDPVAGAVSYHRIDPLRLPMNITAGILAGESSLLLKSFFREKR